MKSEIWNLIFTLGGGIVGIIGGYGLARYQRKQNAKDSFLVFISMQRHSVDTRDFYGWHDKTKPEFRDSVSKVAPFLHRCRRIGLDSIWREYQAISHDQLKQENEADWVQEIEALDNSPRTPKPSEILNGFLDRFEKAAK